MRRPDFAVNDLGPLTRGDLRLLVEHMPGATHNFEEIAGLLDGLPTTLESMLNSDYVYRLILDRQRPLLDISPFLLFSVLLRRSLGPPHTAVERRVTHYLANLLALFVRTERIFRVEPEDVDPAAYVVKLLEGLENAEPRRQFVTYAHIGNYALWLTGLQAPWLEQRHRFGRRPVSRRYYEDFGRAYFSRAAHHRLAREFGLDDVFLRLALVFEQYRAGLSHMARQFQGAA